MGIRWGIFSAGRISEDFARAMKNFPESEHCIIGIAARDLKAANKFKEEFQVQTAYGSYEELAQDKNIDVIYIGSVGAQHFPLSKLALSHGKHVLCEKTLCINSRETRELIEFARSKNLFLMEGIWSRCFPIYQKLREEIQNNTIGDIKQVIASLSIPYTAMGILDRSGFKERGRGTLMDVGVYCIQFATFVFGREKPLSVVSGGHLTDEGVDESTSTTLLYSGGRTATLITHYGVNLPNEALAIGTKGTLKLPSPYWAPSKLETPSGTIEIPTPAPVSKGKFNFSNSAGLVYEISEVGRCITQGLKESPLLELNESLLISEIMDSIRKEVGVKYPQDE